jgi:hypothetical protein
MSKDNEIKIASSAFFLPLSSVFCISRKRFLTHFAATATHLKKKRWPATISKWFDSRNYFQRVAPELMSLEYLRQRFNNVLT